MLLNRKQDYQLEHRAFFGRLSLQTERGEIFVDKLNTLAINEGEVL